VPTYLDAIVARHREEARLDERSLDALVTTAREVPPPRPFRAALAGPDLAVIAEVKRRSPSKGALHADLDPAVLAKEYAGGGAAALSVLTDGPSFGGSADDLRAARAAVDLPVLRKDFTVDPRNVVDARLMGADAVLLIVAALATGELTELVALAWELGLDTLVECHDEREVDAALDAGATLVGVNQRDLVTFEVDHERALRLAARLPDAVVRVAESGVRDAADAARLHDAGYHAVLVGESLVTSANPADAVRLLRGVT
jgi:indole-3-glycerol phosphate synthase